MKRLTTTLSDELYSELLVYKGEMGKKNVKRFSLGEIVRSLIDSRLNEERNLRGFPGKVQVEKSGNEERAMVDLTRIPH